MRQFQFAYEDEDKFINNLRKLKQWCNSSVTSSIFFQIHIHTLNRPKIETVCTLIKKEIPDSIYIGCSSNGNILFGDYCESEIIVICTVFEYFTTKVEILQSHINQNNGRDIARWLIENVENNPWCKCIMCYTTMRGFSTSDLCDELKNLPENVQFFGGGAMNDDMNSNYAFVFSSNGEISDHSAVFALIGGEDFNIETTYVTGWKPLGRKLNVTKAIGPVLYELDGKPAYETYYKYLNIKNDEHFFKNTLEFPFFYEFNGINILRAPTAAKEDGSIIMTADMEENVKARMAYGDPWTILENVDSEAMKIRNFIPEAIFVFSCAARKAFWGETEVGKETKPFQSIAPTSGFYTSGEFLRTNKFVNQHNVTLVIAAMREGKKNKEKIQDVELNNQSFSGSVSMINRLANFIQASTEELEQVNEQLRLAAIIDGLTQVYNRREIQRLINEIVDKKDACSLIMIDIDNFKSVNDNFGHQAGDDVLQSLAGMMDTVVKQNVAEGSVGRWGGEEFMILLPGTDIQKAQILAELLRMNFSLINFKNIPQQTISVGVTEYIKDEDADTFCNRVDTALYKCKNTGKNKVIVV